MTAYATPRRLGDWLSYPRGVVLTILGAIWTFLMAGVVLLTAVVIRRRRVVDLVINYGWAWPLVRLSGVRVITRGGERVRASGPGVLLLFNHGSLFDILVLYLHFPRSFRFGAKIELFKIPLFGAAMRAVGVLPIDRRNRNRVMKIYEEATARVTAGESFALAPEGTRQPEPRVGDFKRGPFEFAINARTDVVPVVICGAHEVLPPDGVLINVGRWRRTITLDILEPVSTEGLTVADAADLAERVRDDMTQVFARARTELSRA